MNKIRFDGIYRKRNDEEWGNDYLIFKSDGSVVDTSSLDDPVNTFFSSVDSKFAVSKGFYKVNCENVSFQTINQPYEIEEDNEDFVEAIVDYSGLIKSTGLELSCHSHSNGKTNSATYEFIPIEFDNYI